jgi:hypothetical protein
MKARRKSMTSTRRVLRFMAVVVSSALLAPVAVRAELLGPPPTSGFPKTLPMHSVLWEAQTQIASKAQLGQSELARELERRGLTVHEGRVHVEIAAPEGVDAGSQVSLASFGGVIDRSYLNRVDAWLPPDRLIEVATSLPPGFVLEKANEPRPDAVVGEGPGTNVINSMGYRDAGSNGSGLTIAVIDVGYQGLSAAQNNGDGPIAANTARIDYATGGFESGGTHGTGCVEAAFDHCPGATWRLYKVDTDADIGTAVTNAIANGVDIITHSLSWMNLGWPDDSGTACAAANQASNAGILFFTSAGNYALEHWQGNFNSGAGSASWHDWVNGDEALTLSVPPSTTRAAKFDLSWNTAGGTDYDIYLYDASLSTVLASGTSGGTTYESISWMNTGPLAVTVHLAIHRFSGGAAEFEIFGTESAGWEYRVADGSTSSPSNASGVNVLSVGAVPWNVYASASGNNPIANYSSQGPSNSGMLLPDFVGPTNTSGFTYASFGGTSCATPNAAGAICAFWSDELPHGGNAVRWLALEQARTLWRDWGAPGLDNVYGFGPCRIVGWVANTTWVARGYGNVANHPSAPYFTIAAGQNATTPGGRMLIFPGGTFPENITLDKVMRVESAGGTAQIGQ